MRYDDPLVLVVSTWRTLRFKYSAIDSGPVRAAEKAIHIGASEPGIGESAHGNMGLDLRQRRLTRLAHRMFERADDIGRIRDRHTLSGCRRDAAITAGPVDRSFPVPHAPSNEL